MKNIILEIIIAVFVILCDAPDVVTYKNPVLLTSHGYGRNPKILETMLTAGENIDARDKNGWTAMMHAAIRNDFEILEILHDADVNTCDNDGRTALILANYDIPNPEVIKYLIRFYMMDSGIIQYQKYFFVSISVYSIMNNTLEKNQKTLGIHINFE